MFTLDSEDSLRKIIKELSTRAVSNDVGYDGNKSNWSWNFNEIIIEKGVSNA